jgi:uncharacterized protein
VTKRKKSAPTTDSYKNFVSRVGFGTGNQNDASHYGFHPVTRNRVQMEWAYRGSWIVGRMVDIVARDMTKSGVETISSDSPAKIAELDKEVLRLRIWDQLCQTIKWSRLYGGSVAFMMIDGQDPKTPLRPETIQKGQFKGLLPMDRWLVNPSLQDLITDFGPQFGKPKFYQTVPDTMGMPLMMIHYSRLLRFEGVELPYWQRIAENLWGQSVLERLWDRLLAFDSTTTGVAQLVYKAHLRTLSIENLREIIAAGGPAMAGLLSQIQMMQTFQTNEGVTLLDTVDKFEAHNYTFSGLDSVLMQLGEQLAGATEIPLVRLFGQSPAGFSTGDTDLRAYYDGIHTSQVSTLGYQLEPLYKVLYLSTFGKEPPTSFTLKFKPLWQMTDVEKATAASTRTSAIVTAYDSQIIKRTTALQELKAMGEPTGMWSNISEEEIKEAEDDPAPSPEALGLKLPPPAPGAGAKPGAKKPAKKKTKDAFSRFLKWIGMKDELVPNIPSGIATPSGIIPEETVLDTELTSEQNFEETEDPDGPSRHNGGGNPVHKESSISGRAF